MQKNGGATASAAVGATGRCNGSSRGGVTSSPSSRPRRRWRDARARQLQARRDLTNHARSLALGPPRRVGEALSPPRVAEGARPPRGDGARRPALLDERELQYIADERRLRLGSAPGLLRPYAEHWAPFLEASDAPGCASPFALDGGRFAAPDRVRLLASVLAASEPRPRPTQIPVRGRSSQDELAHSAAPIRGDAR